jgi:hypothetical protein
VPFKPLKDRFPGRALRGPSAPGMRGIPPAEADRPVTLDAAGIGVTPTEILTHMKPVAHLGTLSLESSKQLVLQRIESRPAEYVYGFASGSLRRDQALAEVREGTAKGEEICRFELSIAQRMFARAEQLRQRNLPETSGEGGTSSSGGEGG